MNSGEIKSVTYSGEAISGKSSDGKSVQAYGVVNPEDIKTMRDKGVDVSFKPQQSDSLLSNALIYWLPMLLLDWCVGVLHPPNAIGFRQGHGLWQIKSEAAHGKAWQGDL